MATDALGICLVGQLRWFALTLASTRHLLLDFLKHRWRGYYVGPADAHFTAARQLLAQHFATNADTCVYEPNVTWSWAGRDAPFELHSQSPCGPGSGFGRRRLHFNVDRLPPFVQCRNGQYGYDFREQFFPRPRDTDAFRRNGSLGPPCTSAISMLMQLWQAARCGDLLEAAEVRHKHANPKGPALWHSRVLRLRSDLYFFHPIRLPPLPTSHPSYSFMEATCDDLSKATHRALYGGGNGRRLRFISDLWMYGSRAAMLPGLREPLRILLSENATLRQDPKQASLVHKAGPGVWKESYYAHPWPHAMFTLFGTSACVNWLGIVGLTRVNSGSKCLAVQARTLAMRKHNITRNDPRAAVRGRNWVALNIGAPSHEWATDWELAVLASAPAMNERRSAALPAVVSAAYRECFGLVANASCTRVVGDRQLNEDKTQRFDDKACRRFAVVDGRPLTRKGKRRPGPNTKAWNIYVAGCEADELDGETQSSHACASERIASFVRGKN